MELKNELIDLLDPIIYEEYSEFSEVYDFEKDTLFASFLDSSEHQKRYLNQFGVPIEKIPEYLLIILGTTTVVIEIIKLRKAKKDLEREVMKEKWKNELLTNGLPVEQINKLVERHFKRLEEILENYSKADEES